MDSSDKNEEKTKNYAYTVMLVSFLFYMAGVITGLVTAYMSF